MRLLEVRLLEGPNVYRLEPAVKIEVALGPRRSWSGDRAPVGGPIIRLGRPVPASEVPPPIRALGAWVRELHRVTGSATWLGARRQLPVTVHRPSDPGHWVVAFPWRERDRARIIAEAAISLVERGVVIGGRRTQLPPTVHRAIARIREAGGSPPEWITDEQRRVPVVSISGTNGKSTTTRMITHIMRLAGRRVGTTTSDGVLLDEVLIEAGDLTGPMGAHAVLRRDDVDVAVLETARGGIVLKGVGYQSNEASVLTNVSADHLDLHGVHTLPELAEVKSVVCRITKSTGTVVLNADDPLVAGIARVVRGRVCFFSLEPGSTRVRRHLANGGRAIVLEDDSLVELEGSERRPIARVDEIPSTLLGMARHNVANALAAAGGARGIGATIEEVADGLRDFRPSAEQTAGRLNLYRLDEKIVIVDFAHNDAGLRVVLDTAEGLVGRRGERRAPLCVIIGTAGDRPDDALQNVGHTAGSTADEIAIKETIRYLRGRLRDDVIAQLRRGVGSSGFPLDGVPIYGDEPSALRSELEREDRAAYRGRPGVVVLMCHADRAGVQRVLSELGAEPVDDLARLAALRRQTAGNHISGPSPVDT